MNIAIKEPALEKNSAISLEAVRVHQTLLERGLETPMRENTLTDADKYERIKASFSDILDVLGLDMADDSLMETPHRIAKMFVSEIFSGLDYRQFPRISAIDNKMSVDEMVKVKDISFTSTCEHHFVTIDGLATVAYIPKEKIIGLSKINRIVRFFAQRPQVQERLTQQILLALQTLLETEDVAITMDAQHYCVKARGVMDASSSTQTTALGGCFKNSDKTRSEFLSR